MSTFDGYFSANLNRGAHPLPTLTVQPQRIAMVFDASSPVPRLSWALTPGTQRQQRRSTKFENLKHRDL